MTKLYSAMLRLDGQKCVVVGGGQVATRKVARLLDAGAAVVVIAPSATPQLLARSQEGMLTLISRDYRPGDLNEAALAFAATDSRSVNAAVADEAKRRGIPVNVADDPSACSFQVPAVLERDGITVSVSTSGRSPAFARRLRDELASFLSPERLALFALYAELRTSLEADRRARSASEWSADDDQLLDLLRQGRETEARQLLRSQVLAAAGRAG